MERYCAYRSVSCSYRFEYRLGEAYLQRARYNLRRVSGLVINLLMFIALLTLILASLPISSEVFPCFRLFADEMLPAQTHILAGNWLFILIAIHLGMQWNRVQPFLPTFSLKLQQ